MLLGDIGCSERVRERQKRVRERQNSQWEFANGALTAAGALLATKDPDYQAVIATALTGLLALKLSDS
jgi:hypothetical protein